MIPNFEVLYKLYSEGKYEACLSHLRSVPLPDTKSDSNYALAYHDLFGRSCYMLGLYDEAHTAVVAGTSVGGAVVMQNLKRALDAVIISKTSLAPTLPLHVKTVLCDGGLCNRLNALIFALILREKYGHSWEISWPRNNWCGAAFHRLFDIDIPIHEHSILHYKNNQDNYRCLFHVNQCNFDESIITYISKLDGFDSCRDIISEDCNILYCNNLIPNFVSPSEIGSALGQLRITSNILTKASEFCLEHRIDASTIGLHIRKTDFGDIIDDNAIFKMVADSPSRYFVCSDDLSTNLRFGQLPNCIVYEKSSFPEKFKDSPTWQSWIVDNEGREFPFNIKRSEDSVVEALVDLLILSRTTAIKTSSSTFLNMAEIFKRTDFFTP